MGWGSHALGQWGLDRAQGVGRSGARMGQGQLSAGAVLVWRRLLVRELWALLGACDRRVGRVQGLGHLLTDDVHQALKGLLDINVVLRACLKELKACGWGREG